MTYIRERELEDGTMLHVIAQLFNTAIAKSGPEAWACGTMDEKW